MATNFADLLLQLQQANDVRRNQFGTGGFRPSLGPIQRGGPGFGPSPLGDAFEEGMRKAEENLIAKKLLEQQIAPRRPREFDQLGGRVSGPDDPDEAPSTVNEDGTNTPGGPGLAGTKENFSNLGKNILGATLFPGPVGFFSDKILGQNINFPSVAQDLFASVGFRSLADFFDDAFGTNTSLSASDRDFEIGFDPSPGPGIDAPDTSFDFDQVGSELTGDEDTDVGGPGEGGTGPDDESEEGGVGGEGSDTF